MRGQPGSLRRRRGWLKTPVPYCLCQRVELDMSCDLGSCKDAVKRASHDYRAWTTRIGPHAFSVRLVCIDSGAGGRAGEVQPLCTNASWTTKRWPKAMTRSPSAYSVM